MTTPVFSSSPPPPFLNKRNHDIYQQLPLDDGPITDNATKMMIVSLSTHLELWSYQFCQRESNNLSYLTNVGGRLCEASTPELG